MDANELVPVYTPYDTIQAELIKQALEDEGIDCLIEGANQASWIGGGYMANTGRWRMRLLVRSGDADRTRQIIETGSWPTAGSPSGAE